MAQLALGGLSLALWIAGAGGCSSSSGNAPADLAAPEADLAVADDLGLPNPFDIAWSACAGTRLAGTCAERFFEPFVACFQPGGRCSRDLHNSGDDACWESGAAAHAPGASPPPWQHVYWMNGTRCMTRVDFYNQSVSQFCLGAAGCTQDLTDGGYVPTSGATYDNATGIFTCPGGEQVDIGTSLGDCAVLTELLDPQQYLCNASQPVTCSIPH